MALKEDLQAEVQQIFHEQWKVRAGSTVPSEDSITLGNDAVDIDATVLYADISDSTKLVDTYKHHFSAEIYRAFLRVAARIIRSEGGTITAYDGDRIMAVFVGQYKNTIAVRTALKINWATKNIVQPGLKAEYPNSPFVLQHTVGIDTSPLRVVQAGIRGSRDLVWIGRAANWAAKLCALDDAHATWVTKAVYDVLADEAKYGGDPRRDMWEARTWTAMNATPIYRSSWWWSF
ncbi:class 3 adenylate cyclase [Mesorhizobium loti]|uniref:Class 3 adenylate cyclase n=1 Tax=Rhizobium loti TaxID=381 RepID=A0A8E2WC97_RHILI|nr:adenylate/guanylate cyclase domain-containing protein [Mesorhizobium loti]PWJ89537.1 class 3 adenylate cyclase [Mesorhizobium loti]